MMLDHSKGRGALIAMVLGLPLGGCYTGFQDFDGDSPPAGSAGDGVDDGQDGGTSDDGGVEAQCLDAPRRIGATSLRRLTQSQYHNTIRDLLGLEAEMVEGFAPDEKVGPFKSNAVAPVVDLQVEQYMDAAELLAEEYVAELPAHLPCDPVVVGEDACAEQWLRELLPRAYRQPAQEADVARLLGVYAAAAADDGFEMGVQVTLQTVLQSPLFLYHVERGDPSAALGGPRKLTGYELAARLSYFLWNSMPDEALTLAAASGELVTELGLGAQVDRMLADPKAEAAIADFHLQWLGLDELESLEKSPVAYPDFDAELAQAMKDDTASFVRWVFAEGDGRLPTLLTGAFTLSTDPALLALYGVERPADHVAGAPIALPADERAGLLTQPALMARHAHADQSSPVHRGQIVRESLLCQPLPPPPADVDNVPPDPEPGVTTRERFAEHTKDPSCSACHKLIDGIGFGFEHYDGTGAFRTMDEGLPVDASGEIIATDVDGTYDGAIELSQRLAGSAEVRECVARQWFRYSLGRIDATEDVCATQQLVERFEGSDDQLRTLIHEVVQSDAFRYRRTRDDSAVITEGE